MPVKYHAKQVIGLTLLPIRGSPYMRYGMHVDLILGKQHFQTQTVVMLGRKQVIVDLKSRIVLGATVGSAKIGEQVKTMLFLEKTACVNDRFARHDDGDLAVPLGHAHYPSFVFRLQLFHVTV